MFYFSISDCLETLFIHLFAQRAMVKGASKELLKHETSKINNGMQLQLLQARSFK